MEEEKKFEVAQEPQEPKKKGSKKGLVIGLIVVLIAAALGVGYYFLFKNDSTKLQLTDKSKVANSVDKIGAKAGEVFEDFEKIGERKINENLTKKAFTDKYTITGKINEFSVEGVEENDVNMVKSMLNGQNIVIDAKGNLADNKFFAELSVTGQKLGNLVFNNDAIGVQVPSVESKYYTVFKNSLKESREYAMFATYFDMLMNVANSAESGKYELTEKEVKHFEDTYGNIIKDNINKDRISSEKAEVTINGETKKCDKVTYSIDAATAKTILTAYVEAFEKDTEGQDIILNKAATIIEDTKILELYGAEMGMSMTADQLKTQAKQMLPQLISELKAELNELSTEGEGTLDIVVYANATTTYRVEVVIPEAGTLAIDLEDNGMKISMNSQGQEVMTIDIENKDNKFTATANMMNRIVLDITNEKGNNGNNLVAKLAANTGYETATMEIGIKNTIKEDSDRKLDEDMEISLKANVEGQKIDVAIMINRLAEIVDNVDVPELNATNSIDIIKEGYLEKLFNGGSVYNNMTAPSYNNNTNTLTESLDRDDINTETIDRDDVTVDYDELNKQLEELQNSQEYKDAYKQLEELQSTSVDMNSLGL